MQRVTYGHVPVKGHHCQEEELCGAQEKIEETLQEAAWEGDGLVSCEDVGQHLGKDDRGEPDLWDSKVAEEVVHGGVEAPVHEGDDHDDQIPQQCEEVGQEEPQEDEHLQLTGL